jgi:hypothetical protein
MVLIAVAEIVVGIMVAVVVQGVLDWVFRKLNFGI